jgi:hypothetical protein
VADPVDWLDDRFGSDVLAYRRGGLLAVLNVGSRPAEVEVGPGATVVHTTGRAALDDTRLVVPGDAAAIIDAAHEPGSAP